MGNTIRLNNKQPAEEWLTMSNIGTDIFLELIINAASAGTVSQNELISYLLDQKEINDIAPGTASLDIDEMPWNKNTMREDAYLLEDVEMCLHKDGDMSGYLFKCIHCNKYHLWVDAN